jgi:biotin transport system substrate-specific component
MSGALRVTLVDSFIIRHGTPAATGLVQVGAVIFMSVLTALAAQVSFSIPFTPVPFTMQPMVVLMGGLALGPLMGMSSQMVYLAAGVVGLPVFAADPALPSGILRLLGPSGGYLLAYPFAAFVVGHLGARGFDRRYVTSVVSMVAGLAIVYAGGVFWLAWLAQAASLSVAVGLGPALAAGLYPFLLTDILKIVVAAGVVPGLWRLFGPAVR